MKGQIAQNLAAAAEAVRRACRPGQTVEIVGVTKLQPFEKVREAVESGLGILGNNYVQEGEKLRESLFGMPVRWHFIGHIQSRKAKDLVDYDCIESLDRIEIAQALQKRLEPLGKTMDVLVEVNVGGEEQKSGIAPADLDRFLDELATCPRLKVRGLMAMPPPLEPVEARRPFFREMKRLFDERKARGFDVLSMGTSGDFLVAIEEGSTRVRLGTTLFGARPPKP